MNSNNTMGFGTNSGVVSGGVNGGGSVMTVGGGNGQGINGGGSNLSGGLYASISN
jgi:hypothetical protein